MRRFATLSLATLAAVGACKKKTHEPVAAERPEVVDIALDLTTPTHGTLSFRVVDAAGKRPVVLNASQVQVKITSADRRCTGYGGALLDAAYDADKRANVEINFGLDACEPAGELQQPDIEVRLTTPTFEATGDALPARFVFPDGRPPPLPELDAELEKLGQQLGSPTLAPPCKPAALGALADPTPVEALDVSRLGDLTGDASKQPGPALATATAVFQDVGRYRMRTVEDRAKLLERVRAIRYVVLLRANKLVDPERASHGTFKPGILDGTGILIDRMAGKPLCMFRLAATSSSGVKVSDDPDALKEDFRAEIYTALKAALTALSPKLVLGGYQDFVR